MKALIIDLLQQWEAAYYLEHIVADYRSLAPRALSDSVCVQVDNTTYFMRGRPCQLVEQF
jgi:hypothetical protein